MLDGTFAGIKASAADWLNRSDLTAVIPDFIANAEAQLSRRFMVAGGVRQMITRVNATLSAEFSTLPGDFMGAHTLYLSEDRTRPLKKARAAQINRLKNETLSLTGKPECYAIVGTSLQLFRAPELGYAAELVYKQRVPALADNPEGNWLSLLYPDAYLYWTLMQSAPYLKKDDRLTMWSQIAQAIADDIIAASPIEDEAEELDTYQAPGWTP